MSSPKAQNSVRVRFAPSPTGMIHVGGIRSSLFNWLWARHNGGVFVLRLEDTDRARLVEGAQEQILESHDQLGISPDEGPIQGGEYGPYVQSQRLDIYRDHAQILVEIGALYRCWCSPERLATLRAEAQAKGIAFKYDRHCLIPNSQFSVDQPHVLRFRIPETPTSIGWDDAVRGRLDFNLAELDDFVAVKADGYPTYHFANVVDDHLMAISHVLRADEWLPSTPKHLLLSAAFGWEPPIYAHLPAVQGPDGKKKLSKRDGAKSVQEYLDDGYLPEALRSFLASLGWNDGTTQEIYTTQELIEHFRLERIQKSPAKFDLERLTWMNGLLIRQMPLETLLERSEGFWPSEASESTTQYRQAVLRLVQERLKFLSELPELTDFFFIEPVAPVDLLAKHFSPDEASRYLREISTQLEHLSEWTEEAITSAIRTYGEAHELKNGHFFQLLRVAITGRTVAPGLFETITTLSKDVVLRRLAAAQTILDGKN